MFAVSISTIVMVFVSLPLVIVFLMWMLSLRNQRKQHKRLLPEQDLMVVCPYCNHVFMNPDQKEISSCPACENYVDIGEKR